MENNLACSRQILLKIARFVLREYVPLGKLIDEVVLESIFDVKKGRDARLLEQLEQNFRELAQKVEQQKIGEAELEQLVLQSPGIKQFRNSIASRQDALDWIQEELLRYQNVLEARILILEEAQKDSQRLQIAHFFPHLTENLRQGLNIKGLIEDYYEKDRELGHGGLARVFLAKNKRLNKTIALKILHEKETSNIKTVERFLLEAALAGWLDHPNIVSIYNFGGFLEHGQFFIEMEYLQGLTLKEWCTKNPWEANQDAWFDLIRQCCAGLQCIHEHRLVHRDLKPGNIMVVPSDEKSWHLKILDFGAAKNLDADISLTQGDVIGTPKYMAPEQFDSTLCPITPATDLYSLGIILYEIFTGTLPFSGDEILSLHKAKAAQTHRPPQEIAPNIPDWLSGIIVNLLHPNPDKRPQSATEVAYFLEINSPDSMQKRAKSIQEKMAILAKKTRQKSARQGPALSRPCATKSPN